MPLSGKQVLKMYLDEGWVIIKSQSGRSGSSHVKVGKGDDREIIPLHKELAKGLEQKLLKHLRR